MKTTVPFTTAQSIINAFEADPELMPAAAQHLEVSERDVERALKKLKNAVNLWGDQAKYAVARKNRYILQAAFLVALGCVLPTVLVSVAALPLWTPIFMLAGIGLASIGAHRCFLAGHESVRGEPRDLEVHGELLGLVSEIEETDSQLQGHIPMTHFEKGDVIRETFGLPLKSELHQKYLHGTEAEQEAALAELLDEQREEMMEADEKILA